MLTNTSGDKRAETYTVNGKQSSRGGEGWRRWTLHHEDVAKRRRGQACRNRVGCGQKGSSNQDPGRKSCSVPEVLNLQYHFHFGSLYFKQRSSHAREFREKHKHSVRAWWGPAEMNSGGDNQTKKRGLSAQRFCKRQACKCEGKGS